MQSTKTDVTLQDPPPGPRPKPGAWRRAPARIAQKATLGPANPREPPTDPKLKRGFGRRPAEYERKGSVL